MRKLARKAGGVMPGWVKFILVVLVVVMAAVVAVWAYFPRCFHKDGKPIIRMGHHYCIGSELW
jgi:hypothetical protein